MTVEICLLTNDAEKRLSLSNMRLAGDHPDYLVADINVLSRGFSCDRTIFFDRFHAGRFIAGLDSMSIGVVGEVVLKQQHEIDHLQISINRLGHVFVSGEIEEYGSGHHLTFCFQTDQTVLAPFLRDFRAALLAAG
jgi:hypothetical protein